MERIYQSMDDELKYFVGSKKMKKMAREEASRVEEQYWYIDIDGYVMKIWADTYENALDTALQRYCNGDRGDD